MSNVDLRRQLLDFFQLNYHKDVKLIDICRAVQQPKKVVNSVLYNLRSEGILQKVVESPPVWRVNDKLHDRSQTYTQTPVVPEAVPFHYTLKDEGVLPCITKNNNFAVLSSVENNRSDPMYVKEQLVSWRLLLACLFPLLVECLFTSFAILFFEAFKCCFGTRRRNLKFKTY